jgi:hypothetical protein
MYTLEQLLAKLEQYAQRKLNGDWDLDACERVGKLGLELYNVLNERAKNGGEALNREMLADYLTAWIYDGDDDVLQTTTEIVEDYEIYVQAKNRK